MINQVPQISADEVYKALNEKKDFVLIDVRTKQEYEKNKIQNSIHISVDEINTKIETQIPDKNKTIYVYCFSGSRSIIAVENMIQLGYIKAYSMTSGLLMWRAKKFPLVI